MVNTSKAVRVAMTMADMSNIELAEKLGVTRVQVSYWRNKQISLNTLSRIAGVLGMKTSELIALGE